MSPSLVNMLLIFLHPSKWLQKHFQAILEGNHFILKWLQLLGLGSHFGRKPLLCKHVQTKERLPPSFSNFVHKPLNYVGILEHFSTYGAKWCQIPRIVNIGPTSASCCMLRSQGIDSHPLNHVNLKGPVKDAVASLGR